MIPSQVPTFVSASAITANARTGIRGGNGSSSVALAGYPIVGSVSALPTAFQVKLGYPTKILFVSPGLIADAANPSNILNGEVGIRIYSGSFFPDQQFLTNVAQPGLQPVWTMLASREEYIPWTNAVDSLSVLLWFFASKNPGITFPLSIDCMLGLVQ